MKRTCNQPSAPDLDKLTHLFNQGLMTEAEQLAGDLTSKFPRHGTGWKVLSVILLESERFSEALVAAQRAVELLSRDAAAHNNLGTIYLRLERFDQAGTCFRKALNIAPDYTKALFNLASLLRFERKLKESEECCRHALAIDPTYTNAHISLGNSLELQNKLTEALVSYKAALTLAPDMANLHTDVLHLLSLDATIEPEQLFAEHQAFGAKFEAPFRGQYAAHANTKDPERHLQIGFVTADMNNHALANFLEPLFELLAHSSRMTLHVYYTKTHEDSVTQRFKAHLHHWNPVADLSDEELASRIRADHIDILIDLVGHTVLNRLLTFARKPAPVQASWLGYLGTTGLQAMDYYVCDPFWIPPGKLDWQFTEKPAYLPTAIVFQPNADAPPINELPALKNSSITFGSFNRHNKINESVIALWSLLLKAVPGSKMVLGAIPAEFVDGVIERFGQEGIEPGRLTFFPRTSQVDYLALHHHVDFCLDTFPHGGGATVAHAAWMGVPTLCLVGETPASRFGATEMHHLGLDGFIAESIEEFIEKGCYWASNATELSALRQSMRSRFRSSILGQYRSFTDSFEALLRTMWGRWCLGLAPAPLLIQPPQEQKDSNAPTVQQEPTARELDLLGALYHQKQYLEAEPLAQHLVNLYPEHGFAWKILGSVLRGLGKLEESLALQIRLSVLRPNDHEAHFNLGCEYQQQGNFDEAVKSYVVCLGIQPNNANAYLNLSSLLKTMGLAPESEMYARQAIALQPNMASAHNNLANALHGQGKFIEAKASYEKALELKPACAETFNNLAITLKDQGHWQEANDSFRRALEIKPEWAAAHSNLLYCMSHDVHIQPDDLHNEHLTFGEVFEGPLRAHWPVHANIKDPDRILNIGFVSADLYDHALANFLEPIFEALAKTKSVTLHAYYTHILEDSVTKRMQQHFAAWHKVAHLSPSDLATQIAYDSIDILFDLTGHTAHNRLLAFAQKPAPIQVSWLGYLGTTGLQAMDYYLCDRFWIPPGELDWQFAEKMAYLPSAVAFRPSEHSPAVNALPALGNGHITFGSFNRPNKLNESVIILWSMLLRQVPEGRMVLGGIPRDSEETLRQIFAHEGISQDRLVFFSRTNLVNYLTLHHQVDLCLDTFPYGGGATTANAGWMGVPTLSLAGETPPSRFGSAMTHHLGLDAFVATSIEDFVKKGSYWAENLIELSSIRHGLRERFSASPLGQYAQLADHLETTLRTMWLRWCNNQPPITLGVKLSPALDTSTTALQVIEPSPLDLEKLTNLFNQQRYDEAESVAYHLTRVAPEHGFSWKILGLIRQAQERYEESLPFTSRAIELQPHDATNLNNLGVVLHLLSRLDEAEVCFRKAIDLEADYGKAFVNLGSLQLFKGKSAEAQRSCERAVTIDHRDASAYIGLGNAQEAQGKLSEAQASYYRADMAHEPRQAVAHSNVLYLLNHDVLVDARHLLAEHITFSDRFETPLRDQWPTHANLKDPARCLQIGFVSGDLNNHALVNFLTPLFSGLVQNPMLILHAYCTQTLTDSTTQQMHAYFAHWHSVANLDDTKLAQKIKRDGIDILIDLSGHTMNNRLLTFARKPAPIQVSWLGYLGTTGLKAMDYYICDPHWVPPGELDWQLTEKPAFLPAAMVFQPIESSPKVNRLPARTNGYVTFGSFNRINKLNDSVILLWSLLLKGVPSSRLVLGAIPAEEQSGLAHRFANQGIAKNRLTFFERTQTTDYLELHHKVDLCVDTFPHSGGATTCYAAWMGVPTLSLAGETLASRFGATVMHHLDLDDFVASSIEEFVTKGRYWAANISELAAIRMTMRVRFKESPLGQEDAFCKNFETTLRKMWQTWCKELPASPIGLNEETYFLNQQNIKYIESEKSRKLIKQFCIAHKALELPVPENIPVVWLGSAPVQTNGKHVVYHAADLSEDLDAWHNFLGGSSGTFLIEKILCDHVIEWTAQDRISIFQYRKFLAKTPMGILSKNYPGMYLIEPSQTDVIDLNVLYNDIETPYLIPQLLNLGNIYSQYSACHKISDLLRYTALAIDLKIITESESFDFLNSSYLIPGGIEFGVYPITVFMRIIKNIRSISMKFLENNIPTSKNSFQRRALSFCNERLGSYLLLEELNKEYNNNIPNEIFGYIHTVTEGGIYYGGAK
jgi:predicted O-linked N-acetylglucosamine transferase (SPINDLY family)